MIETSLNNGNPAVGAPAVKPLQKIVILGGGPVGWTVAAALAARLGVLRPDIVLITHPGIDQPVHSDSTSSRASYFHAMLGADERALLNAASGTFKLGVEYLDCGAVDKSVVHAFGDYGLPYSGVSFHQLPVRLAQGYSDYEKYSLAATAMRSKKFVHPQVDTHSVFSSLHYGLHLNAVGYSEFLKGLAVARGVVCLNQALTRINYCAVSNKILSVVVQGESAGDQASVAELTVEGELFIDCTGSNALLMQKMQGFDFNTDENLSEITRVIYGEIDAEKSMAPATQLRATDFAIIKTIPLQGARSFAASLPTTVNEADLQPKLESVFNVPIKIRASSPLVSGRLNRVWLGNCIAMGEAAGSLPDFGVSSLELVRNAVVRLLDYFPDADLSYGNSAEYNRLTTIEFERAQELTSFILYACCRAGSELAQWLPDFSLSEKVEHKLELFKETGCIATYADDLLLDGEWASLMISLGFHPVACGIAAQQLPEQKVTEWCAMLEKKISTACLSMPEHMSYLRRFI